MTWLPAPDRLLGDVVAALANADFFRLRGVLVGTAAFQTYAGMLGVRFPRAPRQTGDADRSQFHSIAVAVGDPTPPMLDVLKAVDAIFAEVPDAEDSRNTTKFVNAGKFAVEFLTPNRSRDDHQGKPARMPTLGGASATPLRFLDFLIQVRMTELLADALREALARGPALRAAIERGLSMASTQTRAIFADLRSTDST